MKKSIIIITTIFMVVVSSGCSNNEEEENMISYKSGTYYNKNWEETVGTYNGDVVPDENAALEIAMVIFNNMSKSDNAHEYKPQKVFYDVEEEIWIVSFWKDYSTDNIQLGGSCSIAIQKNDGKVLRIWFGE